MLRIDDKLARQIAFLTAQVILREEGQQYVTALLLNRHLREKVFTAEHSATAHADQMHACATGIDHRRDHVHITGSTFHTLLVLNPAQQRYLVA